MQSIKSPSHSLVPSYFPSEGIELPPLPPIFIPHTAEGRLNIKNERRLNSCSFRDNMVGPTFDSNWVIPLRLCMGSLPWGDADASNTVYPAEPVYSRVSGKNNKITKAATTVSTEASSSTTTVGNNNGASTELSAAATAPTPSIPRALTTEELALKNKGITKWKPPPVKCLHYYSVVWITSFRSWTRRKKKLTKLLAGCPRSSNALLHP